MPCLQRRILCSWNPLENPSDFLVVLFLSLCVWFGRLSHHPGCTAGRAGVLLCCATVSPRVCHCPCMFSPASFQAELWGDGLSSELWSLKDSYQAVERQQVCLPSQWSAPDKAWCFFSGAKAVCVDLLLENVLPFENTVEGKSLSLGFEMLWFIFRLDFWN